MISNRVVRLLVWLFVVFGMAACGPLPKPFKRAAEAPPNPLVESGVPRDIAVKLVNGPSIPMAQLISKAVADDLGRRDIVAYTGDRGTSRYVLEGWVEGWQNKAALSPPLRIQWVLTERDGKLVANHMENVYGTAFEWEYGSPRILREIGEGTGGAIARVVRPQVASETAEAVNPSGLWIRPISDAPGDGNFSLTRAIGFALSDSGLKIAEDRMQAKHVLKGNVRVDSPVSGRQNVEIAWTVIDRKGKELGNAVQRNAVPEGTFDGRWGQTAVMIAMAAVGGIKDILLDVERNRRTRGNPLFPSRLDLPAGLRGPSLPPPSLTPDSGEQTLENTSTTGGN